MITAKEIDNKLKTLQTWFKENPKLPQSIEPIVLRRFLKCMYYDVEETKELIELNYSLRNKNPNIFITRNPYDDMTVKALKASDLILLPGLTPEKLKIMIFRMVDLDPSSRDSIEESKVFFMTADARFTMPDTVATVEVQPTKEPTVSGEQSVVNDNSNDVLAHPEHSTGGVDELKQSNDTSIDDDLANGDIQIVDIAGYTMRHVARISFSVLRIYMKFLQDAYPSRLRAVHVINCPSFLDKMIAIVKPFIRDEVYRMIHFHTDGLESLYEHVPRDMLPTEYGGNAGKIADLKAHSLQLLHEKQSYLSDANYWKADSQESSSYWSWF